MSKDLEAGIENCVATCARVERGQGVYIVTQEGAADPEVVEALSESARERGGDVHVVSGPVIPRDRPEEIPASVLDAYERADVLFAHYPSLKREALHPHFPVIVADHIAGFGGMPEAVRLELKEGRVVSMEGGDPAMHETLNRGDGFIDSWHAGVNLKTVVPLARADNPVQWYSYPHCSPAIVHFHVGRSHDPVDVACFDQTIEIDGRIVYDQGRLAIWDEPDVDGAVSASGMSDSMMSNTPMTLG